MSGRVERGSATFKVACAMAVLLVALAAPAVAEDESLAKLLGGLGLSVEQVADNLANTLPAGGGERRLVRWEQAKITVGIVASSGVTAQMIGQVKSQIGNEFDYAGRQLDVCVRHWERLPESPSDATEVSACGSRPVDIDLLVDISERSVLADIDRPQLPSDLTSTSLTVIWQRIRGHVLAKPTQPVCTGTVVADAAVQKLAGGAAIIRTAPEQNALLTVSLCARDLGYILLGSTPIPDTNGPGGTWDGGLLKLLYRPELRSGESRGDVLAKLRAASGN
jgi:hypothetical protein